MITFLLVVIILQLFWIGRIALKFNNNFVKWTRFYQSVVEYQNRSKDV